MASCGQNQKDQQSHIVHTSLTGDTLTYSYQDFIKTSQYIIANEKTIDTSYFRISYPQFSSDAFNMLIKPAIWIEDENSLDEAAQSFIEGYDEFVEDPSTQVLTAAWFKDIQSRIYLNTPKVLSLKTEYHQYTGGAHGNNVAIWSNYDVLRAKKIELSDIISQDKYAELTKIAEKEFRRIENLADTASLKEDFFFTDGIFTLNDNFGLTKSNLIFFYNEYEIKPYSEGNTIIELPYADLGNVLNKRGKGYIKSIQ